MSANDLSNLRIGIIVADGTHDHEYWFPYYRFREAGAEVLTAAPKTGIIRGEGVNGKDGLPIPVDMTVEELTARDIHALYLPGGLYGPVELRFHRPTLELVRAMMAEGRIVAAICHAQWILVSADVLEGREVTGPRDMVIDMVNAGGIYEENSGIQAKSLRDNNLFTSPGFPYLPEQFRDLMPALAELADTVALKSVND